MRKCSVEAWCDRETQCMLRRKDVKREPLTRLTINEERLTER
jgi:hypothetical protein